jgi:hypothetical protein
MVDSSMAIMTWSVISSNLIKYNFIQVPMDDDKSARRNHGH